MWISYCMTNSDDCNNPKYAIIGIYDTEDEALEKGADFSTSMALYKKNKNTEHNEIFENDWIRLYTAEYKGDPISLEFNGR